MISISEELSQDKKIQNQDVNSLHLSNGVSARIDKSQLGETLQIFSNSGELIFEYASDSGRSRVMIPSGDLEFVVPNGGIHFRAERGIQFSSKEAVRIKSPEFDLSGERGRIHLGQTEFTGFRFLASLVQSKLIIERLETVAGDVIQKAKNIYKSVEGLSQSSVGRMRTLVKSTFHLKAEKIVLKAETDFKVKGNKIHLG